MKSGYILTGLLVVLLTLGVIGCTDKTGDNPTRADVGERGLVLNQSNHTFSIFFSTAKDPGFKPIRVYLPPGYNMSGSGIRYPSLYLLPPFRGDELYYFEHGLAAVADRLIAEGKIEPMIIVTIDGRSLLGGSFYTNSACQGNYFTALFTDTAFFELAVPGTESHLLDGGIVKYNADATVSIIDSDYRTFADPSRRAIGGVGMGGYGAFRAVLQTDLFGSVSAVNAPLDFDGISTGGFLSLFNEVFPPGSPWIRLQVGSGDGMDSIYTVDTSFGDPKMSMVIAAASAFTPQHQKFSIDSVYRDIFNQRTFAFEVEEVLTSDQRSLLPLLDVHVPFDSMGRINNDIWRIWLENNIDYLHKNASLNASGFNSMEKLLLCSDDAEFYFNEQMDGFIGYLDDNNMKYEKKEFTGTASHYLYDLLEDILIFHSNNLNPID